VINSKLGIRACLHSIRPTEFAWGSQSEQNCFPRKHQRGNESSHREVNFLRWSCHGCGGGSSEMDLGLFCILFRLNTYSAVHGTRMFGWDANGGVLQGWRGKLSISRRFPRSLGTLYKRAPWMGRVQSFQGRAPSLRCHLWQICQERQSRCIFFFLHSSCGYLTLLKSASSASSDWWAIPQSICQTTRQALVRNRSNSPQTTMLSNSFDTVVPPHPDQSREYSVK